MKSTLLTLFGFGNNPLKTSRKVNISYKEKNPNSKKLLIYNNNHQPLGPIELSLISANNISIEIDVKEIPPRNFIELDLLSLPWPKDLSQDEKSIAASLMETAIFKIGKQSFELNIIQSKTFST